MAGFGSALGRAVAGGVTSFDDAKRERERELLIAAARQRQQDLVDKSREADDARKSQDALYEKADRDQRAADRARADSQAELAGTEREELNNARFHEAKQDPRYSKYDEPTLRGLVRDPEFVKTRLYGKPDAPPAYRPTTRAEYLDNLRAEGQIRADNRAPAGGSGGGDNTSWQVLQTPEGIKQINPKTGEVRNVTQNGQQMQSKPAAGAAGGADRAKKIQQIANARDALNSFEKTLDRTGAVIRPGVDKATLQSEYENIQLQMKELQNLGVLAGPDLMLMRRILNDPTDLKGFVMAGGNAEEHKKRTKAQIASVRDQIKARTANLEAGNAAGRAGGNETAPAAPGGGSEPDADLWEKLVKGGMSRESATAAVQKRKGR